MYINSIMSIVVDHIVCSRKRNRSNQITLYIRDIITNKDGKKCLDTIDQYGKKLHMVPIDQIFFGNEKRSTNNFKTYITYVPAYLVKYVEVCQCISNGPEGVSVSGISVNLVFVNDNVYAQSLSRNSLFNINMDNVNFQLGCRSWTNGSPKCKLEKYPIANIISHRMLQYYLLLREWFFMSDIKFQIIAKFIIVTIWG
jgi:hypothetical protein